ncbi:MAG: CBS domain-containing protein [bacterium]|nr:CBS domain-containing protein [bacterium]
MSKRVKDYMDTVELVGVDESCLSVISKMIEKDIRIVAVVTPNQRLQGVITLSDILRTITSDDIKSTTLLEESVEHIMTDLRHLAYIREDMIMLESAEEMVKANTRSLIVVKGLEPVGILHQSHIISWWYHEIIKPKS